MHLSRVSNYHAELVTRSIGAWHYFATLDVRASTQPQNHNKAYQRLNIVKRIGYRKLKLQNTSLSQL